ncbi:MAG: hypothetical protein ACQEWU_10085 [Bacillota bacterium]|uniref:hypothetical protein n=1 Tax=Virgibacillus sp. Bac332 TaxID=2419842 RepID=UPI000EF45CC1|nr:hypothetical protein [Virgibacillus sp. Bac332]
MKTLNILNEKSVDNEKSEVSTLALVHAFKSMVFVARQEGLLNELHLKYLELEEKINESASYFDFYDLTGLIDNIDTIYKAITLTIDVDKLYSLVNKECNYELHDIDFYDYGELLDMADGFGIDKENYLV